MPFETSPQWFFDGLFAVVALCGVIFWLGVIGGLLWWAL